MKSIVKYINEGIKVGSKTKINNDKTDKEITSLSDIYNILCLNGKNILKYPGDRIDVIKDSINDWMKINKIKTIKIAVSENSLYTYNSYVNDKKYELNLITLDENVLEMLMDKVNRRGMNVYRNNYCEVRSTNESGILKISIKPEYRYITFYILDAKKWEDINLPLFY